MADLKDFEAAIASGDRRTQLVALRDLIAHELAGKRCKNCEMLQIRSGETAALALRLQKVIEDIDALPKTDGEVSKLDELRAKRVARDSDASDTPRPLGSKNAQRRTGGRRPSS